MSEHAYKLFYRGVQLGDEAYQIATRVPFSAAQVLRLFRSPIAALHRTTTGKVWSYEFVVHIIKADMVEVAEQIEQWHTLADGGTGDVELYKGVDAPTLEKLIPNAYLQGIDPTYAMSPARGRIAQVRLSFATNTAPV